MNYYNPYFYSIPNIATSTTQTGLLSRLFGGAGISFSRILNGTQRALNFANQAIPFVKQVKPMISNAKTMFKVMNEFKKSEKPKQNHINNRYSESKLNYNAIEDTFNETNNGPTFFR